MERVLEWCSGERIAAIPFGGGTSVVGGVTPQRSGAYNGAVSIDLRRARSRCSRSTRSRAPRASRPARSARALEAQLGEHGLTLRHFPQSFEYSTLGGWIATRAAGHFATLWTHIEDFVESVRAITPAGAWESRRLPGSGAGVSPDRMLAGSEGTLGVITQAWVRVQPRPSQRSSAGVRFASFLAGAECVRAISQVGPAPVQLPPARPRRGRARRWPATAPTRCSCSASSQPTTRWRRRWRGRSSCAPSTAAPCPERRRRAAAADAVSSWRDAFLGAPYARDALVAMGVLAETFETAITWERFPAFHERVSAADRGGGARGRAGEGRVFCRFTHVYPDGPAPYFTVLAPARSGRGARAVGGDQAGGLRRDHRRGRHHHPSPRRRARPPPLV